MPYVLLTGATGLVGRYLLRDLLSRSERVAVLVRSDKSRTARDRVGALIAHWEQLKGRSLCRPVDIMQGETLTVDGGAAVHV